MKKIVYTIGHSDLDLDSFIKLLRTHKIQVLIDIRSQPYSSYVKHFNKETIKASLHKAHIDYYYGGNYLGGKPSREELGSEEELDAQTVRKSVDYKKGIQMLRKLVDLKTVVLMCAEENPIKCHRHILIAKDLIGDGFEVRHIRSDGSYELASEEPDQVNLPLPQQGHLIQPPKTKP